jgi:LmbE family N-acetylglucosaminyl deacetylase
LTHNFSAEQIRVRPDLSVPGGPYLRLCSISFLFLSSYALIVEELGMTTIGFIRVLSPLPNAHHLFLRQGTTRARLGSSSWIRCQASERTNKLLVALTNRVEVDMRIVVFGAHMDDESLGLGGTMYKHSQRGDEVTVVYLTDGSGGSMDVDPKKLSQTRYDEARNACKILGVRNVEFLGFKDGFLWLNNETLTAVGNIIRKHKPDRVYTHHADAAVGEDNLDHANVNRIVMEAVFKCSYHCYPEFGRDVWKTREVYAYEVYTPLHNPTTFVDITDVMSVKRKAMSEHKSQHAEMPYWFESTEALNRWRAVTSGLGDYAEAFKALRTTIF